MQHTVPVGQQSWPQALAHSQMPASGPPPQQYPVVASKRLSGAGQHLPPEQLVPAGQLVPSLQQLSPPGMHWPWQHCSPAAQAVLLPQHTAPEGRQPLAQLPLPQVVSAGQ